MQLLDAKLALPSQKLDQLQPTVVLWYRVVQIAAVLLHSNVERTTYKFPVTFSLLCLAYRSCAYRTARIWLISELCEQRIDDDQKARL